MVVEANRDAFKECLARANEAIAVKDLAKAQRLLLKASRLDPKFSIDEFLKSKGVPVDDDDNSNDRSYAHDDHYDDPDGLKHRRKRFGNNASSTSADSTNSKGHSSRADKPENNKRDKSRSRSAGRSQADDCGSYHVERIRHCKDYYEILQVSRDTTEIVLKKKYRELALKLHPDKCQATGATEAFKALGNAYTVLSDPGKREAYDRSGMEEQQMSRNRHHHRGFYEYDVNRGFESEVTPEEIFEMFFGGGFPGSSVYRRRTNFARHEDVREERSTFASLLQLLPLFVLLFGAMFVQLLAGEPAFSLKAEGNYNVLRYTKDLRVPYYVKSDFISKYGDRVYQVEVQVEEEYVSRIRLNCYREKNQRETAIWRAKMTGDSNLYTQAQRMDLPNCRRLEEIYH